MAQQMQEMRDLTLSVPDVSCDHCVQTVYKALSPLPGVEDVHTDLASKTVHVRFDAGQLSLDTIEEVLDDAGYPVAK